MCLNIRFNVRTGFFGFPAYATSPGTTWKTSMRPNRPSWIARAPLPQQRQRTAIGRAALSRPIAQALHDQLIDKTATLLDYGCGRGSDVRILNRIGCSAVGWDPAFRPEQPLRKAHVVNLGFVVNVIEDPAERASTLGRAFRLAKNLLIVSARMHSDRQPAHATVHCDGVVTRTGTFQKFYAQEELRHWIDATLQVKSIAAAPGIFYVFTREPAAQAFLSRRFLPGTRVPSIEISKRLFQQHGDTLQPLIDFYAAHGRLPSPDEYGAWAAAVLSTFGSLKRAFGVIVRSTPSEDWEWVRLKRRRDLLVLGALSSFERQLRFSDLPLDIRHDVRALFGSYTKLRAEARPLLFSTGQPDALHLAFEASAIGKLTPNALYVHGSALGELSPLLRIYEGCAMQLVGAIEGANIIKLHRRKPAVSYLSYPRFDRDPHPILHHSTVVDLQQLDYRQRNYRSVTNPPLLHRKDTLVSEDYRLFKCFQRLTRQEERLGLLDTGRSIGTRSDWLSLLRDRGLALSGHRVVTNESATKDDR